MMGLAQMAGGAPFGGMPGMPGMPGAGMPGMPGMPGAGMGGAANPFGGMPGMPGMPGPNGMPMMPGLPNPMQGDPNSMPGMADFNGMQQMGLMGLGMLPMMNMPMPDGDSNPVSDAHEIDDEQNQHHMYVIPEDNGDMYQQATGYYELPESVPEPPLPAPAPPPPHSTAKASSRAAARREAAAAAAAASGSPRGGSAAAREMATAAATLLSAAADKESVATGGGSQAQQSAHGTRAAVSAGLVVPVVPVAASGVKRDATSAAVMDSSANKRNRRPTKEPPKPGNENKVCVCVCVRVRVSYPPCNYGPREQVCAHSCKYMVCATRAVYTCVCVCVCVSVCAFQICKNCGTRTTPFWRKDKHDGRPLCNACGLYYSKNDAPRPKILWKAEEGCVMDGVEGQFGIDHQNAAANAAAGAAGAAGGQPQLPGAAPLGGAGVVAGGMGAGSGAVPAVGAAAAAAPQAGAAGAAGSAAAAAAAGQPNIMMVAAAAAASVLQQSGAQTPLAVAYALQTAAAENPAVAAALHAAGMPGLNAPKGEIHMPYTRGTHAWAVCSRVTRTCRACAYVAMGTCVVRLHALCLQMETSQSKPHHHQVCRPPQPQQPRKQQPRPSSRPHKLQPQPRQLRPPQLQPTQMPPPTRRSQSRSTRR